MESRTILLALHIASVTAWLGADLLYLALSRRLRGESADVTVAWARVTLWMHERYYAVVALLVLATGVALVLDGDWSWSTDFIWVGIGAIVGGATLGGGGLRALAARRLAALEAGDAGSAVAVEGTMFRLGLVVTALPLVAIYAMVDKWGL